MKNTKSKIKTILLKKFNRLFPDKRLLAIQLNGFSHSIYCDGKTKESPIEKLGYSGCAPEIITDTFNSDRIKAFFCFPDGLLGHNSYQENPVEIVYVHPRER